MDFLFHFGSLEYVSTLNYNELSATLKKYTRLDRDPVAIYLSKKAPTNAEKLSGSTAFCKMFDLARNDHKSIYASKAELGGCETGFHVLGLGEIKPDVRRGDPDYEEHGVSPSLRIARRIFSHRHVVEANSINYVTACPLDMATEEPDVIFIQGKPGQISLISYAYLNFLGKYPLGLAGNSFCSACIAAPYLTGEMTYGLGLHYYGGPPDIMKYNVDEMFVGIPGELLKPINEQLMNQRTRIEKIMQERRRMM
ncbi:hypothetical protein FJY84_02085 [Candidatus Bathyarchaeota archaeon]|nr:hypothetical protein [Candidatus Bathyarchaeota archaeon]